jgi:hypothetical protein
LIKWLNFIMTRWSGMVDPMVSGISIY